jgi:hypothetical protein
MFSFRWVHASAPIGCSPRGLEGVVDSFGGFYSLPLLVWFNLIFGQSVGTFRAVCEGSPRAFAWRKRTVDDEDINTNMSTSTPAAPSPAQAPSSPVQVPLLPPGPVTRARARELNYIMLLKNEGPEE